VYIYYRSEPAKPGIVDREDCAPSHLWCSNSVPETLPVFSSSGSNKPSHPEGTSFFGARAPAPAPNGAQAPFLEDLRSSQTPVLRTVVLRNVAPSASRRSHLRCSCSGRSVHCISPRTAPAPWGGGGARSAGGVGDYEHPLCVVETGEGENPHSHLSVLKLAMLALPVSPTPRGDIPSKSV
jgi:hypothetical protein